MIRNFCNRKCYLYDWIKSLHTLCIKVILGLERESVRTSLKLPS